MDVLYSDICLERERTKIILQQYLRVYFVFFLYSDYTSLATCLPKEIRSLWNQLFCNLLLFSNGTLYRFPEMFHWDVNIWQTLNLPLLFSLFSCWCWRGGAAGLCYLNFSPTMAGMCCCNLVCRYLILCTIQAHFKLVSWEGFPGAISYTFGVIGCRVLFVCRFLYY